MTIPGRLGCTRVVERLSTSASIADHTCTSLPLTVSIRARAMPQVPAPRTPILNFFTFVSSVSAPGKGQAPCRWIYAAPSRCPAPAHYYDHCTRKRPQRQASAALHKYLTSLCNFSVTSHVLCKPFALRGISCYYSILVGFVGICDRVS